MSEIPIVNDLQVFPYKFGVSNLDEMLSEYDKVHTPIVLFVEDVRERIEITVIVSYFKLLVITTHHGHSFKPTEGRVASYKEASGASSFKTLKHGLCNILLTTPLIRAIENIEQFLLSRGIKLDRYFDTRRYL